MRIIKKGATSQSIYVEVLDSTSTTGARKTGLTYNTASLVAYYVRNGGSATAITLATLTNPNSAWSSGGFKEVDATNMKGVYRLDVPDAALAAGSGDSVVVTISGATGMVQVSEEVELYAVDPQDATGFGLSRLDAAVTSRLASGNVTVGTNNDKTGYALVANGVDAGQFTQAAADKVWATGTRALTDKIGFALSAAGIQAIWDALTSALVTSGSIGKYLVDKLVSVGSSGSTVVTLTASPGIDGVEMWVTTSSNPAAQRIAQCTTGSSGSCTVSLDPGSYWLFSSHGGYRSAGVPFTV